MFIQDCICYTCGWIEILGVLDAGIFSADQWFNTVILYFCLAYISICKIAITVKYIISKKSSSKKIV